MTGTESVAHEHTGREFKRNKFNRKKEEEEEAEREGVQEAVKKNKEKRRKKETAWVWICSSSSLVIRQHNVLDKSQK